MICLRSAVVLLVLGLLGPVAADAQPPAGVQLTPDGKRTLINKQVGAERWAITVNSDDATVTGNVFQDDGSPPAFLWCEEQSRSGGTVGLRCLGSVRCPLGPCSAEDWQLLGEVSLPEEFFFAPLSFPSGPSPAAVSAIEIERVAGGAGTPAPSGVQTSPDGKRHMVSKDIAGERWAIELHEDDLSVAGNVFFPDGREPQFVWCEKLSLDDGILRFSCQGASRCTVAPCPRSDWTPIAEVPLPESFFAPPDQVRAGVAAEAGVAALGDDGAFVAILLATDAGYSNRQILRALLQGTLRADGRIVPASGNDAVPEREPIGFFAASSSAALASPLQAVPTPQQLCEALGEQADMQSKTDLLVRLRDRGFSLDQVRRLGDGELRVVDCNDASSVEAYQQCIDEYGRALSLIHPEGFAEEPGDQQGEDALPEGFGLCGNGVLDGEECDGAALNDQTCVTRGFVGGRLRCDEVCRFDESECREESDCGDSVADTTEVCDGTDVRRLSCTDIRDEFIGGELRCAASCQEWDTSLCLTAQLCGNGRVERIDDRLLEDCDGADFGGRRCEDVGNFVAGILRCRPDCTLDTADCRSRDQTDCGNGMAEGDEQCDRRDLRGYDCTSASRLVGMEPFPSGSLGCTQDCKFSFDSCSTNQECPNDVREGNEACDGSDFGNATCESVGLSHPEGPFVGGSLRCDFNCNILVEDCVPADRCGNGVLDERVEDCDRNDFGDATCESVFGRPGRLLCTPDCRFDPESCQRLQRCGDDFVEGTEQCDGFNLGSATCESLGLGGGELRCGADCQFDTTRCVGPVVCGDDLAEGTEQCDGRDLQGATCENLGFDRGELRCSTNCQYDTTACQDGPECGDGQREGEEECDGTDLGGATCGTFDFAAGDLGCFSNCTYDTRACLDEAPCTEQLCPDGTCIPVGGDCCGGGAWCDPGLRCTPDTLCCPFDRPLGCADRFCMPAGADCCGSLGWCNPGTVCAGTGCCPSDSPQSCGDGTCTQAGRVCCGNGTSCPGGTRCLSNGQCG